ncbi:ParA family protein [Halothece sp. PCC 7418]|uniref:MinD/ParA family ATP-binding protein n=1 Tax=Halothece sp. (strain PCC 7418) TaxID=65093 RepID=UPI0002A05A80|nr:MinD/ParA family protein [Halothece sp. PCC 7418]AFZ45503.1 ParA family protein [Halothece sp. PCC 7418]
MPKVIAIHSYRGGTGKSSFTANLATAIANQGKRVGVVDIDLPSPGIHNIFNFDVENLNHTLNTYLWGATGIEDTAYDVSNNVGIKGDGKIFLVPSSTRADDIARILKEGYKVSLLHDGFRKLVKSLKLDYLFIDTHPGLSKDTFLSIAISHFVILILRPDKQDYQGTAVTVDVARRLKVRKMVLAVNKALTTMSFKKLRDKIEQVYDLPVAGIFPLSVDMAKLASEGVFIISNPNHPISEEFQKVAQQIME